MDTKIFEKVITAAPYREIVDIRPDAKLVVFKWEGRTPPSDICEKALVNLPECVKRAKTNWGEDGFYKENNGFRFICDGNYGKAIIANVESGEFHQLLDWLDTYFYDLGTDRYGGHWREAKGSYSNHCYHAVDYNEKEIEDLISREKLWSTFDEHMSRVD